METLISDNFTRHLNPQFSPSLLLFHLPSLSRKNGNFLHFSHRTGRCNPKILTFSSVTASSIPASTSYGGWDDPRLSGDSDHSGESDQFRNFLISIGIDDKKYIFMFLLGIVCALAISRVRVSSIVVFPAFVLVFAGGFSFGFVQRGHINGPSISGSKRRSKDEIFRVCTEKLRNLVDFFDGFDVKVSNLKNGIKRGIESKQITIGDLESYVEVMESMRLSALSARNVVEASIDGVGFSGNVGESSGILVENQEVERTLNQKPNRRRKEMGESGFDLFQFLGGLFRENSVGPKHNRLKDIVKREGMGTEVNDQTGGNILTPAVEEMVLNSASNENAGNANAGLSGDSSNKPALDKDRAEKLNDEARRKKVIPENGNMNSAAMDRISTRLIDSEEYSYQDNRLRPMNNHRISLKTGHHNGIETWASHDSLLDSVDFSVSLKHMETESSFRQEQTLKKSNEAYMPSHSREKSENETHRSFFREERVNPEDDPLLADHQSAHENEVGSSSSSVFSDDVLFDRHLREANDLLKQARECLMGKDDEGRAEIILYKSARLLSKAVAMKPMSLLAVGQLGNTYLLHGEVKLKISRELRTLLSRSNPLSVDKRRKVLTGLDDQLTSKDKVASFLVNVCEECEELLVEAGRKYRMALSIDGNDARALYNWGLALSFRAQLIADIGPEAAFDADKVFLAAIDKFDALMSKSNVYAPDALFRWGGALQQRSRLRPRNSKEKVKLLQQAKRLYEDALHMDSDNLQVRGALSSCISELNFRHF